LEILTMKNIILPKEWSFITTETHNEKPNIINKFKRELLFLLQTLLLEYEDERNRKKKLVRKEIYLLTKKFYLQ